MTILNDLQNNSFVRRLVSNLIFRVFQPLAGVLVIYLFNIVSEITVTLLTSYTIIHNKLYTMHCTLFTINTKYLPGVPERIKAPTPRSNVARPCQSSEKNKAKDWGYQESRLEENLRRYVYCNASCGCSITLSHGCWVREWGGSRLE